MFTLVLLIEKNADLMLGKVASYSVKYEFLLVVNIEHGKNNL